MPTGTAGNDTLIAPVITRVSTTAGGAQGDNWSYAPLMFPDGTNRVMFLSLATNLGNGFQQLLIKDLDTGAITRVSASGANAFGNGYSWEFAISPDGQFAAFRSLANNLVAGDTNGVDDIFLKNLTTGAVTRLSTDAGGVQQNAAAGNGTVSGVTFSPDGARVAFISTATNLVAGDSNGVADIFIKTIATGAIERVSLDDLGGQANGASLSNLVFSPDGTKILFQSSASNLVAGDTNGVDDVFMKDLVTGVVTRISATGAGGEADGTSSQAVFSPDGTKVAFTSSASNLVAGDTNGSQDVFIKDLATGEVIRVSISSGGGQSAADSYAPVFSPDGTRIAMISRGNLGGTNNDYLHLAVVKDLTTGVVTEVSVNANGGYPFSGVPTGRLTFSPDGLRLVFDFGGALVAGDTNGQGDVYIAPAYGPFAGYSFDGGAGDDIITGGPGADYIKGGSGADAMSGGGGNDTYIVDDLGDTVGEAGGGGTDLVHSQVSWILGTDLENLKLAAPGRTINGTGNDLANLITGNDFANTLTGLSGADTLIGGGGVDTLDGGDGQDNLDGGLQNDILYGGADADDLVGGGGADWLDGGAGIDVMTGGAGHDTYVVDDLNDQVIELPEPGTDVVRSSVTHALPDNVETLILTGSGLIGGMGNSGRNTITGNDNGNFLYGLGDNDTLGGGGGGDTLSGGPGFDILDGGDDDDDLYGNAGGDKLTGGGGADAFRFANDDLTAAAVERDQILDLNFADGDVIDLGGIDANTLLDNDQAFVWAAKFTRVAGQAILKYVAATDITTLELDVDGDGRADFLIAINGDHRGSTGNLHTGPSDTDGGWVL